MHNNNKLCFVFSGQGSQYIGMGKELYTEIPSCKPILECANDILGYDISDVMWNGSEEDLAKTVNSQPAILLTSLFCLEGIKNITPEGVLGHSLGEYAALYASGMLNLNDTFMAIKYRSVEMDKAAKKNPGKMAAVLGLPAEEVSKICRDISQNDLYVAAVNFNSPVQTVIAGNNAGVQKATEALLKMGAKRVVQLSVSAAFHSKFMEEAGTLFKYRINSFNFNIPICDFYSNLLGKKLTYFGDMPDIMSRHIYSPVLFTDELNAMWANGYRTFVELGSGKVLTGLIKKTLPEAVAFNIENKQTLIDGRKKLETI